MVKDLVTDMAPFFKQWKRVRPAFRPVNDAADFARIPPDSPRRDFIDQSMDCITCGACYSACTLVAINDGFIGPAALNKAYTLIQDERDADRVERLHVVAGECGALRCHTLFNCAEVCPKGIVPTRAIQRLKQYAVRDALKPESHD